MMVYRDVRYLPAGDTCIVVEFGNEISAALHNKVRGLMFALQERPIKGIIEVVPTYRSLAVHYDPLSLTFSQLKVQLNRLTENMGAGKLPAARVIEIPVIYGGDYGPDLAFVAGYLGISTSEVISLHTSVEYLVYMLGFTPGFPYLGGLDERLAVPRLDEPRTIIPGGSVGIAGRQTGIYPMDSPGGWRLIGRTPLVLYDPAAKDPVLLRAGDHLKFRSVCLEEYTWIQRQVQAGNRDGA